ncbi:MAG: hypothetical protein MUC62_08425 [Candidatus Thermoplasmatota archaeon]|jgi:prepilin signal peptidase PulO-like enzyme (type II secretory pathway)|nr:hypothetical protein [Candidatus Thermoplasmatota archaeon]
METVQIVDLVKIAITSLVLIVSALSDLRTRRVPDRMWVILGIACAPLLFIEMGELGGWGDPFSFLSLPALAAGVMFVIYGYPEPREMAKGNAIDIAFASFFILSIIGAVVAFFLGDRGLVVKVGLSLAFMLVYYLMYTVPIAGARLLHGGADAKCLIVLAAVFPWQVEGLFMNVGPFYEAIGSMPVIGLVFNPHLSTLLNAAVMTGAVLVIYLLVRNIVKGDISFPAMFTSYMMDVEKLRGRYVWVVVREDGKSTKEEPEEPLISKLKMAGTKRVWVTPKVPFILSLALAFMVQMIVGNLVLLLLL